MNIEEIRILADKARMDMTEAEMQELSADFDSILGYISQIDESGVSGTQKANTSLKNIYREDEILNKNGEFSDSIIANMPDSEDGFLKVKKIL